jgi:hypothetical protein
LRIPYREVDVDLDSWARDQLSKLVRGRVSTPTLVFGDRALIAVEPSPRELDELLSAAGYTVEPPATVVYHGSLASLRVPPGPCRGSPAVTSLSNRYQDGCRPPSRVRFVH